MKLEQRSVHAQARKLILSPVMVWALLGLLFTCFSLTVFGTWVLSPEAFAPVPLSESDMIDGRQMGMLRGFEVISVLVALLVLYLYLIRPWVLKREVPLDGLLLIGALLTYVLDTTINFSDFHMAWNKHSFNMGTWGGFFPGHEGPTRYAEAWFWGPPMYMYFGVALASIQLKTYQIARSALGLTMALLLAFVAAFVFDFMAEASIIRFTEAYAWPYTVGGLTVWAGTQFQFPLYESFLVAVYASLYSWLLHSAQRNGLSFIERGANELPSRLRLPLRLFAATGFAALCTAIYFGGFYSFSLLADTRVDMPPYLMFSDKNWQPPGD